MSQDQAFSTSARRKDSPEIRIEGLKKSFRGGKETVLKGVDLTFHSGKLTYVLGPSGAGKSVLLKHILGLLSPDEGRVWVGSQDISKLSGEALLEHRQKFGMLFQNSALFDDLTVFENVAFPLREHTEWDEPRIEAAVGKALLDVGLASGLEKFPNELSGGMRKRVGLARAIIREPLVLLYDEPTTGLDPVTRTTVDDLIAALKSRLSLTSIVISHDIPSALQLADEIAFLYEGKILFSGTPEAFVRTPEPAIQRFLDAERRTLQALLKVGAIRPASP
jgi:phospholipid/cholesterol/gamma-HCH transport system ATP-binding protein